MTTTALTALETPPDLRIELREVPPPDPRETLRRASRLVSRRVGIVRAVGQGLRRAQDPPLFSLGVVMSALARSPRIANPGKAGGGGETLETALAAAIGETVERYATLFYDPRRMILACARELGDEAVAPERLRLYTREQLRSAGRSAGLDYFDERSPVRWAWGWSLTEDRPRLVPAALVYLGYAPGRDEAAIGSNASTGLAAGLTREAAILSGLLEVVERDSFVLSWLFRRVRARVTVDDPELRAALERKLGLPRPGVRLDLFDLRADLPLPALLAVLRRPAEFGPALCLAAAARTAPAAALSKCALELGQGLPYLRYLLSEHGGWRPREDFSDLTSFDRHLLLYVKRPDLAAEALAFLDATAEAEPLSAIPDLSTGSVRGDVERSVEVLRRAGHEVIVVDITPADVRELGFVAVRVLVPGLVPLHAEHRLPYLGVARVRELPRRLGWVPDGADPLAEIHPMPHPFA